MSYVVHNLTKRTIVLSDLRAEIGPQKMLDLEKVAERNAIDRSYDLRTALGTKRLRLCSQGVVSNTAKPEVHIVEKIIEKHHYTKEHHYEKESLDEAKILAMMRSVMKENQPQPQQVIVESDNKKVLDAVAALQQQIQSMGGEGSSDPPSNMPSIDPVKLAEMQAKAIDKITNNIETGNKKQSKRVILKNTNLSNLADELD